MLWLRVWLVQSHLFGQDDKQMATQVTRCLYTRTWQLRSYNNISINVILLLFCSWGWGYSYRLRFVKMLVFQILGWFVWKKHIESISVATDSCFLGRGPEGSTMNPPPPPPHPYKTMFFLTLRVSTIRNKMLTVKILGLSTDLQLFSKGTLKTRIPNYRAGKILLWQLWPCNSTVYVLNDLNVVLNERWVF